jgi:hypothetical protein
MPQKLYQIQIALRKYKPKIWRRILVDPGLKLTDLHLIIQTVMGWSNTHLHQFRKHRIHFVPSDEDISDLFPDDINYTKKKTKISDILLFEKDKAIYDYDFGDGWEHDLVLEKIIPFEKGMIHPVCVKGKYQCPPEDCGGVWGYEDMLEVLRNPKHPEYKEITEWIGEDFDPDYFNLEEINALLKDENYGCAIY